MFAALFTAIGVVAAFGGNSAAAPFFCICALVIAVLLALMAWGVTRSIRIDTTAAQLDQAIEQVVSSHGGQLCDCEHEHDPSELHITDAESCAHDGTGAACTHDCQTCVLAALRPTTH